MRSLLNSLCELSEEFERNDGSIHLDLASNLFFCLVLLDFHLTSPRRVRNGAGILAVQFLLVRRNDIVAFKTLHKLAIVTLNE